MSNIISERIRVLSNKLTQDFYAEIESEVCCCLAAGAPIDKLIISSPKIEIIDGMVTMTGSYGFNLN